MCGSVIKSFSLLFRARRASMWGTLRWSRCYLIPGGGCGCVLGGIPYALGAGGSFALSAGFFWDAARGEWSSLSWSSFEHPRPVYSRCWPGCVLQYVGGRGACLTGIGLAGSPVLGV